MINQLVSSVCWGSLDYLFIDTPPGNSHSLSDTGTSDEHMAILDALRSHAPDGAVLVTTPQVPFSSFPNFSRKFLLPMFAKSLIFA
jgi:Mrp family chromosome partitioning ATPase